MHTHMCIYYHVLHIHIFHTLYAHALHTLYIFYVCITYTHNPHSVCTVCTYYIYTHIPRAAARYHQPAHNTHHTPKAAHNSVAKPASARSLSQALCGGEFVHAKPIEGVHRKFCFCERLSGRCSVRLGLYGSPGRRVRQVRVVAPPCVCERERDRGWVSVCLCVFVCERE